MKRFINIILLLIVVLLTACGTSNKTSENDPKDPITQPTTPDDPSDEIISTAFTVGVFDEARGGNFNFADSSAQADLRSALKTSFPNMVFLRTSELDASFFESVDLVMLSSAKTNTRATDALSADEQLGLKAFVEVGGGALIFVDNDSFAGRESDLVNESFLDPFGLDVSGTLKGEQSVVVLPLDNPVTNGSFGRSEKLNTLFPGYFESLGRPALNLAMLDDNGEAALAYLMRGALEVGSGGVSFFSDVNLTADSFDENASLVIRNAIAYAAGF